jgi:hypothetical protein
MTVTVHAPTLEDRRATLRWLAHGWDGYDPALREMLLGAVMHESMGEHPMRLDCTCGICAGCIWVDYLTDLAHLDGLSHEVWAGDPLDIDSELPYEVRLDNAEQRVAGLEDLLLRGAGAR